ncbi:MAG TPA: protein kinase [Bryobacteraceae bacterium]|nr:protein kinase [Bryobacteraceae bacterium]
MKCARCNAENPDTSRFCGSCAASLSPASPASLIATQVSTSYRTSARPRPVSSSSDSSEEGRFVPGTLLGDRYRIISLLGSGGMGEVYRATDLRLSQAVALKFLPEEMALDPKALARFHNEVRIARQVGHANVCRVYDIGEVEGLAYISMEYVDGEDLHSLLRRIGRLPSDKALEIARKLCAGLAAAHDKGVLHRDLKPANIMIDGRGHVLITDFGLAGVMGQIEGAEARNGTPGYMAPEQLSGREVSAQSDIYALGVVLYEMFTGKRPFNAETRAELVKLSEEGMPPPPRGIVKDIDPAVESVILRCLAPDPRNRPQSAIAVLAALPGGDPLAAALAAGETPSPEMVAASGQKSGCKMALAVSCLAATIVGLAIFAPINQQVNVLDNIPFSNPPEVLAAKAREIVQKLGYSDQPASSADGFEYRFGTIDYMVHRLKGNQAGALAKGRPPAISFWYRSSPVALWPRELADILVVTRADPPENVPGMLHVSLDPQGRMSGFNAVPPQFDESNGPWPSPDWTVLFAAAGLDQGRFTPTEPRWAPAVMADARAAWTGTFQEVPDIPIRVEASAYHGKPVDFTEVLSISNSSPIFSDGRSPGDVVYLVLQLVVLIGLVPFARYNLRLGRGDTRGAFRLGLFAMCVGLLTWVIGGTHVAGAAEGDLFLMAAMRAVFVGASMAFNYISFEPFVRRKWPQTLISWSRVLAGGFRDPLVGRDLLLGTAIGVTMALIQATGSLVYRVLGVASVRVSTAPLALLGGRHLTGVAVLLVGDVLYKALGTLFLLFLARTALRKQWLAAGVLIVALAAINAANAINPFIGWPVNLLFFGLGVFTLMRCGLLALAVAYFVSTFVNELPMTTDFSVWYSGPAAFTIAVIVALAVFSFRTALAGQPLFKDA